MKGHLTVFTVLFSAGIAMAHEAPKHAHSQLIPIPAYNQPYGEANATASLKAAKAFLDSFDDSTKSQFVFDLNAPERPNWSNLPAGIVERTGIAIADLSDEQRKLLFDFLASSLSKVGYENVLNVMAAEAFLSTDKRAKKLKWDPQNYWVSFYGDPSADASWGWQYGGHHLGLNLSINNNVIETMSPSFVGTEPAIFTLDGVDYESVVDMHRAGYAVFSALDKKQQKKADAGKIPKDVLTGPGEDGTMPPPIGINASELNADQQALLLAAISEWISIQPQENAVPRMVQIETEIADMTYAWSGNEKVNSPAYMRIMGPTVIIELLSTGGNVGESASGQGHYHTIYRNPTNEYGG